MRRKYLVMPLVMFFLCLFAGCATRLKEIPESSQTFKFLMPSEVLQSTSLLKMPHIKMDEPLVLRGVGVKNVFLLKVFKAGFYLPADVASEEAMDVKVPKSLSVMFFIKVAAHDFTNYTIDNMKPNLTMEEFQSLKEDLVKMGELFPNINPGDTLELAYKPGTGTSFIHNGKIRGTIPGEVFSKAIFSTWIGPKPIDNGIKFQVLGLSNQIRR